MAGSTQTQEKLNEQLNKKLDLERKEEKFKIPRTE